MVEFSPLETLKVPTKKVVKAAENAFFNYGANPDTEKAWAILQDDKVGKFLRTQALFTLLRSTIPDAFFEKLTGNLYKYQEGVLPIDPEKYSFSEERLGGGYECNVYRLIPQQPELPTLVIKIDQFISRSTDKLIERAKTIRAEYEEVKECYTALPGFIPDEFHFIGKSPRGGKPAIFTIQEFFGKANEMQDLFRGISREELSQLLRDDAEFREEFEAFVDITLKRAEEKNEMIDTLGDKNLVVIEKEGKKRLVLLDPHVWKHPKDETKDRELLQADLNYLKNITAELTEPK